MGVLTDVFAPGSGLLRKKSQDKEPPKASTSKDTVVDTGPISEAGGAISKGVGALRRRSKSPSKY